jgi:hypothetical protein
VVRFDWYQGTVKGSEVAPLCDALTSIADGFPQWTELDRAPHGFRFGRKLADMDGPLLQVWWGGQHQWPHVVISGEVAPRGAELLRGRFPEHTVSRADVCIDYGDPGAYDRLQGIALGVAQARGIKVDTRGDHLITKQGRTLYLGAASSHTRLRLYDKAAELRGQFHNNPERLAEVPQHLARLECQVRPQTPQAKAAAAQVDPVTLMGSAAWTRALMREVADLELEPFQVGRAWRQSDDDRAYSALLAQYGGLLQRICGDLGSWACVGQQIGDDLQGRAEAKRMQGGRRGR